MYASMYNPCYATDALDLGIWVKPTSVYSPFLNLLNKQNKLINSHFNSKQSEE